MHFNKIRLLRPHLHVGICIAATVIFRLWVLSLERDFVVEAAAIIATALRLAAALISAGGAAVIAAGRAAAIVATAAHTAAFAAPVEHGEGAVERAQHHLR